AATPTTVRATSSSLCRRTAPSGSIPVDKKPAGGFWLLAESTMRSNTIRGERARREQPAARARPEDRGAAVDSQRRPRYAGHDECPMSAPSGAVGAEPPAIVEPPGPPPEELLAS